MSFKEFVDRGNIFRGFERVEIVRMFPQSNSFGAKKFIALFVANSHSTPIVALQENQRALDVKASRGFVLPSPPTILQQIKQAGF